MGNAKSPVNIIYMSISDIETTGLKTEDLVINMGPQHPSTHGVLRLKLIRDQIFLLFI